MQNLINRLTNRLENLKHFSSVKMIMSHPWIVCSEDLTYSINVYSDGSSGVEIDNDFPTQYTESTANELVNNFNCSNGNGKIRFMKIDWKEYNKQSIANTEEMLSAFGTTC